MAAPGSSALTSAAIRSRAGRSIWKVVPRPSSDWTVISPPRLRTRARTWASPMPSPGRSCGAGAAEQLEHALDGPARAMPRPLSVTAMPMRPGACAAGDRDAARPVVRQVLHGVVEEVAEHLLERQPVGDDERRRLARSSSVAAGLVELMLDRCRGAAEEACPGRPRSGLSARRPSRDSLRMALISPSILRVEERMKPIASGRSSSAARLRLGRRSVLAWSPSMIALHGCEAGLELAGEAHDVDQRRAQVVA